MTKRVDLDNHESRLSRDAQTVLRVLRYYDASRDEGESFDPLIGRVHFVNEIPIAKLARDAKLSIDLTRSAIRELVDRKVPGVRLEDEHVIFSG
jgi:hypothetical protein